MRSSAADTLLPADVPPAEVPQPGSARTGALSFITGFLRGADERQHRGAPDEMADDMVTGRLERSLGYTPDTASGEESQENVFDRDISGDRADFLESEPAQGDGVVDAFAPDETLSGEDLEMRFGQIADPPGLAAHEADAADALFTVSAEDERILWGEAGPPASYPDDGPTFTYEDVWGESPPQGDSTAEHLFADIFVPDIDAEPEPPVTLQEPLLREALERDAPAQEAVSLFDLRLMALEGYEEEESPQPDPFAHTPSSAGLPDTIAAEAAALAVQTRVLEQWEEKTQGAGFSLRRWLSKRTLIEKILLAEVALVVVLLLIAVPVFIYQLVRGPEGAAASPAPRSLPAHLPYPTGVELPGGWSFPLNRSTFVEGRWQPAAPEWLDGSELRRVVALPWNRQTEAVIRTFKGGDLLRLTLSNGDTVEYTITSVERVVSSDNAIFTDTKPSLVIILYQQAAGDRWVVFSKP